MKGIFKNQVKLDWTRAMELLLKNIQKLYELWGGDDLRVMQMVVLA